MAKGKKGKGGGMIGPFYTQPGSHSLGPHKVEGPRGGMSVPDPIGLTHGNFGKGPSAKGDRSQSHDKE